MSDGPHEIHVNWAAANLLLKQAERSRQILERLAADFAANEPGRAGEFKDLVKERHVRQASEFLFNSVTRPSFDANVVPSSGAKVFISFSHDDVWFVNDISERLVNAGVAHFKSDRDIRSASDWAETIWDGITSCQLFISVLTPQFLRSRWRDLEGGAALASQKKMLTILHQVDVKDIGSPFDRWQSVVVETSDQLEKLVETVKQIVG